jgi:hypothetical protein
VESAVKGKLARFAYAVPVPFDAVFQPVNVYPVLVNPFAVSAAPATADSGAVDPPSEPFPLNVTIAL